ncbi:hypothetical protein Lal_00021070 [Lupinus albus]|nr:hypothetical protein Lal_00021070 [Lupinus albus]
MCPTLSVSVLTSWPSAWCICLGQLAQRLVHLSSPVGPTPGIGVLDTIDAGGIGDITDTIDTDELSKTNGSLSRGRGGLMKFKVT